jgi:hypothetical protein
MRKAARNCRLVLGAQHLLCDRLAPACARKRFAAIEHAVLHPARRNVGIATGVGARGMTRDHVVDFEPVLDGFYSFFQAAIGRHLWLHCKFLSRHRPRKRATQ